MEIESFKMKFVHIAGKDNILAATLSRLINIDPDVVLEPQLRDYEFGCYGFETLPKAKSTSVGEKLASVDGVDVCEINITYDTSENAEFSVKLPLSNDKFACLQENDGKVCSLKVKVTDGLYSDFYLIKNGILYRSIIDNGHKFKAAVVPEELTEWYSPLPWTQSIWSQWLSEKICCNQMCISLERNEEACTGSLQKLCYIC